MEEVIMSQIRKEYVHNLALERVQYERERAIIIDKKGKKTYHGPVT